MTQIRLKNLLCNKFKVKNVLYTERIMILKKHFKISNNFKKHQWLRYFFVPHVWCKTNLFPYQKIHLLISGKLLTGLRISIMNDKSFSKVKLYTHRKHSDEANLFP